MNTNLDIVKIENALFDVLSAQKICENIFVGERPTAYDNMSEFIVVQVNSNLRDRTAFGDTITGITIYVKDIANVRNSPRLSEIYQKCISVLPSRSDPYRFEYFSTSPSIKDGNGFFKTIINLRTFIKR